ncbi:MAG: hypothetical protein RSB82_03810 [Victivallaceae bacterium]
MHLDTRNLEKNTENHKVNSTAGKISTFSLRTIELCEKVLPNSANFHKEQLIEYTAKKFALSSLQDNEEKASCNKVSKLTEKLHQLIKQK